MVTVNQLKDIASVLRRDILKMTTKAESGHATSSLSSAEILAVLFFNEMKYDVKDPFNPDNDEFILSKGHASPVLYSALFRAGCVKEDLSNLRKFGSQYEGHPLPSALKWIKVATGSLGQGLSAGIGMALASKIQKRDFRTYVLLGDSECAEGSIYEAAQIASHYKLDNLCAIIDVNRLGQSGETMLGHNLNAYKKRFEAFGWNSIIVDGHDVKELIEAFLKAQKEKSKPTIIIAKTLKGKGVSFIENKEGWHGKALSELQLQEALAEILEVDMPVIHIKKPKPVKINFKKSNIKIKTNYKLGEVVATREAYGKALVHLSKLDDWVIATDGEVKNSTYAELLMQERPDRYIEAYIAEQNMVSMALGLSVKGFNVFCSTFAAFFTRAHDQIRMAALSSGNITFCGSHAGVSIGEDGPSQMGLEDISMFRALPESIVLYPSDAVSTEKLVELCYKTKGIKYIRSTRAKTPVIYKNDEEFPLGEFKVLRYSNKDKVLIVAAGITLHEALKAYQTLKDQKISVAVIDCYSIKPFNTKKFLNLVKKSGNKVLVVEDHYPEGGISEMIMHELNGTNIPVKSLCIKKMPHSGKPEVLLDKYEINDKAIIKTVKEFI